MMRRLVSDEKMPKPKNRKKIAAAILIAAAIIITIAAIHYQYPPEKLLDSTTILPGQTYLAWNGGTAPPGYVFHEIKYNLYINGTVVYGSGTLSTSWTCPEYVYGENGKSSYKVNYAVAWTVGNATTIIP